MKAALKSSIFLFFLEQLCYFNLSPQGDGNSKVMFCSLGSVPDFNLSPQGDGNRLLMSILSTNMKFQLIPARGRKLVDGDAGEVDAVISTYPRKGTETDLFMVNPIGFIFQLIPARGRKPNTKDHILKIIVAFQLIPVKTLSGAARRLSRRESFSGCHLPCTKLPLSGELARRKP